MNLIATLKQRLTERQQIRQVDARTNYRRLLEQLADGEEPPVDEVETALTEAEKSVDELQADVELLQRRRQLAAALRERPDVSARLDEIQREKALGHERFEKIRKEHVEHANALQADVEILTHRLDVIAKAEEELQATCTDEETLEQEAELRAIRSRKHARQRKIKEDLWGYSAVGKFTDVTANSTGATYVSLSKKVKDLETGGRRNHPHLPAAVRKRDAYAAQWVEPATAEFHELTEQIAGLDAELETLRLQKLKP